MGNPTIGWDGTVKSGSNVADFIGSWTVDIKHDESERGPYCGDGGVSYVVPGARKVTGSLKGELRSGASTFRTALLAAEVAGTSIPLTMESTNALKFDAATVFITGLKVENKASDGCDLEFEFRVSGASTLDDNPYAT